MATMKDPTDIEAIRVELAEIEASAHQNIKRFTEEAQARAEAGVLAARAVGSLPGSDLLLRSLIAEAGDLELGTSTTTYQVSVNFGGFSVSLERDRRQVIPAGKYRVLLFVIPEGK